MFLRTRKQRRAYKLLHRDAQSGAEREIFAYIQKDFLNRRFSDAEVETKLAAFYEDTSFALPLRKAVAFVTVECFQSSENWGYANFSTPQLEVIFAGVLPSEANYRSAARNVNFTWPVVSLMLQQADMNNHFSQLPEEPEREDFITHVNAPFLKFLDELTLETFDDEMITHLITSGHYVRSDSDSGNHFRNEFSRIVLAKARAYYDVDLPDTWVEKLSVGAL